MVKILSGTVLGLAGTAVDLPYDLQLVYCSCCMYESRRRDSKGDSKPVIACIVNSCVRVRILKLSVSASIRGRK